MNGKTTWEIHGGVDILWLGDNMKALNGGDGVKAGGRHRLQHDLLIRRRRPIRPFVAARSRGPGRRVQPLEYACGVG